MHESIRTSGRTKKDLSMHHGVFNFFDFTALPKSDLRETFYARTFPGYSRFVHPDVPALQSSHDYDNNVHNTTIYS